MFKSGITSCQSRQIPNQNFGEDVGGTENMEHLRNSHIEAEFDIGSEVFESIFYLNQVFIEHCNHYLTWIRILIFISRT